jgi:hypothetical protein
MELKMKNKLMFFLYIVIIFASANTIYPQDEPKLHKEGLPPTYGKSQQLTEENEEKILNALQPKIKEDLLKAKNIDKDKYYELLSGSPNLYFESGWEFFLDPLEKKMFDKQQKIEQVEIHTEALGFLYQNSKSNEQQKIKTQLRNELEQLFDLKEEQRRLDVEMLEFQLQELKTSLDARKKNKNEIINRRLTELIGMGDYLDWD